MTLFITSVCYCWGSFPENVTLMEISAKYVFSVLLLMCLQKLPFHFKSSVPLDRLLCNSESLKSGSCFTEINNMPTFIIYYEIQELMFFAQYFFFLTHSCSLLYPPQLPNYRWQQINENKTVYIATLLQA